MTFLNATHQLANRKTAHVLRVDTQRRQRRKRMGTERHIVKADQTQMLRDTRPTARQALSTASAFQSLAATMAVGRSGAERRCDQYRRQRRFTSSRQIIVRKAASAHQPGLDVCAQRTRAGDPGTTERSARYARTRSGDVLIRSDALVAANPPPKLSETIQSALIGLIVHKHRRC